MAKKHFPSVLALVGLVVMTTAPMVHARAFNTPNAAAGAPNDFNGDGFRDVAIGVPLEDLGSGLSDAGAVNVIYGSASGLAAARNQLWSQNSSGIQESAGAGEYWGSRIATGDFNRDGYADMAVSSPSETIGSFGSEGAVNVIYGSASGLTGAGDQLWYQTRTDVEGEPRVTAQRFGESLAAGDYNGDGYHDLAIGIPHGVPERTDTGSRNYEECGGVLVLYGSASKLSASNEQLWSQHSPGIEADCQGTEGWGYSLLSGDFNGDRRDDLAVGELYDRAGTAAADGAGALSIIYGSASGLASPGNQLWYQADLGNPAEEDDYFGEILGKGDFNRDGRADLAIGMPGEDVGGLDGAGLVHVMFGSASGLTSWGAQVWHQNRTGVLDTAETRDFFGGALTNGGDFGKGTFGDLVIGVQGEDHSGVTDAGAAAVLYGSATGLAATGNQLWHQNSTGIADVAESGDGFGWELGRGDFDGDASLDVVTSVPAEDVGAVADAGAVHVLYGSSTGPSAAGDQFWHQNSTGILDSAEGDDWLGSEIGRAP